MLEAHELFTLQDDICVIILPLKIALICVYELLYEVLLA